jgi:hypothetical protein
MSSVLPEVSAFLRRDHGPYIGGRWTPSDGTAKLRVFNPGTGQVIAHVVDASACDIDHPVRVAYAAFADGRRRLARCIRRGEVGLHPSSPIAK